MLAAIVTRARTSYARLVAGAAPLPWWSAVVVTASSARQAERYSEEIRRRLAEGKLPQRCRYLAVPDPEDRRIGSGGATLHALRALHDAGVNPLDPPGPILVVHSGGDSRRLPQYSLSGKLFSALPVATPWGEPSTVFDETLALSTAWAAQLPAGLVVASGDVVLTFDSQRLLWDRAGVCGVAMRQPAEAGTRHGVYIAGEDGRVYSFLQKPSIAESRAAGAILSGCAGSEDVALDTGLLRFDCDTTARLAEAALATDAASLISSPLDLYEHFTLALTGQWSPGPLDAPVCHRVAGALRGIPFWCSLVEGEFTHVGATRLFRDVMTGGTNFSGIHRAHQLRGCVAPDGMRCAGTVVDSVLAGGGEIGSGAIAIECDLDVPVRAGRGAILHGLAGLNGPVDIPEDTVVHQIPVMLGGVPGVVTRAYGVEDDPKRPVWFNRPIFDVLREIELDADDVWPGIPEADRALWNASVFPVCSTAAEAWSCAQSLIAGKPLDWSRYRRLSLSTSAAMADGQALAEARARRMQANWRATALSLAASGTDIRPLLAHSPGIGSLAAAGSSLSAAAEELELEAPTEAASRHFQSGIFLGHAGLTREAEAARERAFECIRRAVGIAGPVAVRHLEWKLPSVSVSAPCRIDLGGGWSDTPPFCLDWGGMVLNVALELNGAYPIRTTVTRLPRPVIRLVAEAAGCRACTAEFKTAGDFLQPPAAGSPFAISRAALEMLGVVEGGDLARRLESLGGGIEVRTDVDLPVGSGLGTSSILAAAVVRAIAEMLGLPLSRQELSDLVMRLEQFITTGGGWQDQAGSIYPGAKLISSGPGLRQRLRVQPVDWTPALERQFTERLVLYYTGISRVAKNLLAQVVGSYLARESATVQVLHSIKTLALEMWFAMREGDWESLGRLMDRHWALNQLLDPHTTNAPVNALLGDMRPYVSGAKLAGAGGGGFMILLARDPLAAGIVRARLRRRTSAAVYDSRIAESGLCVAAGFSALTSRSHLPACPAHS